jgi:hypothetical protein
MPEGKRREPTVSIFVTRPAAPTAYAYGFPVSLFDLVLRCTLIDSEKFVVILAHARSYSVLELVVGRG